MDRKKDIEIEGLKPLTEKAHPIARDQDPADCGHLSIITAGITSNINFKQGFEITLRLDMKRTWLRGFFPLWRALRS